MTLLVAHSTPFFKLTRQHGPIIILTWPKKTMNVYGNVNVNVNIQNVIYSNSASSSSSSSSKMAKKRKAETTNSKTALISKMTCSGSNLKLCYYFLPSRVRPNRKPTKFAISKSNATTIRSASVVSLTSMRHSWRGRSTSIDCAENGLVATKQIVRTYTGHW